MKIRPLIIIGGGASGLAAGISAAEAGVPVLILEKKEQSAKKLLVTGNGRCNFTNLSLSPEAYYTHEPAFIGRFLKRFTSDDALRFFRELGMEAQLRENLAYPLSMQAQSVRLALTDRLKSLNAEVRCGVNVTGIHRTAEGFFEIHTSEGVIRAEKVILSCGTTAGVKDKEPYTADRMLVSLGIHLYPLKPSLVKLTGKDGCEESWDGVRSRCSVTLLDSEAQGKAASSDLGEVQFTSDGLSGIPVFQISHPASEQIEKKGFSMLQIDFLPDFPEDALKKRLETMKNSPYHGERALSDLLTGFLPKKLIRPVLVRSGIPGGSTLQALSEEKTERLLAALKKFSYRAEGTGKAESAQVMRGGADLREFTDDLESRRIPGLYVTGELLDADGKCGGYNLHFAWGTGILAGKSAAGSLLNKPYDCK